MAFTHECILNKNTPEIREKLESLGIRYKYALDVGSDSVIKCRNGFYNTYQSKYYQSLKDMFTKATDCGTNEELFLAIAALRDDSDYMQWFEEDETIEYGVSGFNAPRKKIGEKWYQYSVNNNNISNKIKYNFDTYGHIDGYEQQFHKATVEELIKHFT